LSWDDIDLKTGRATVRRCARSWPSTSRIMVGWMRAPVRTTSLASVSASTSRREIPQDRLSATNRATSLLVAVHGSQPATVTNVMTMFESEVPTTQAFHSGQLSRPTSTNSPPVREVRARPRRRTHRRRLPPRTRSTRPSPQRTADRRCHHHLTARHADPSRQTGHFASRACSEVRVRYLALESTSPARVAAPYEVVTLLGLVRA